MDILIELIKNQKHYTKKVNYSQKLNIGTKSKCESITLTTPAEKKEEENKMTEERKKELFDEIKSYGSTEFRGCKNFKDIEEVILSKESVDTYFEDEESYSIEEYHGDEYETIATFNFEFRGSQLHNIKVWVKVVLEDWDEEAKCYCQESIMRIEDLAIMF